MTISSGSHWRRSSRTPRSAAEGPRQASAVRLARLLPVLAALAAVTVLVRGDDRDGGAGQASARFEGPLDLGRAELLGFVKQGFRGRTDFDRHSVPLTDFVPAGPPRNGIPAIDQPRFVTPGKAEEFLGASEPVVVLRRGGEARAYPFQILVWHEIVNDRIAGEPIAVTYCPLCNSTVAFSRRLGGRTLEFGTTGVLRNSDLVMYDRQTESWWQQLTGEAVVGELTGARLQSLPSQILSWRQFRASYPGGRVLSRDTGFERDYGSTPYAGYEAGGEPHLFRGRPDDALPAMERVVAIPTRGRGAVVYPFSRLSREAPINDRIDGRPVAVFFDPRVASVLDDPTIGQAERIGASSVFLRSAGKKALTFDPGPRPATFVDRQTGSVWSVAGRAVDGALAGRRLRSIPTDDQLWFAVAAFYPGADVRR
jgi:Protein of unknown function (DUF3179)